MTNMNGKKAIENVIAYAGLENYTISDIKVVNADGLYEVSLVAGFLKYDAYVDAADGEVVGFMTEPTVPCYESAAAYVA